MATLEEELMSSEVKVQATALLQVSFCTGSVCIASANVT